MKLKSIDLSDDNLYYYLAIKLEHNFEIVTTLVKIKKHSDVTHITRAFMDFIHALRKLK